MGSDVKLQNIDRQRLPSIIDQLMALEQNWTEIGEAPWNQDNFMLELPNKWNYSYCAFIDGKIVGYAICSSDGKILKLNKILVSEQYRGKGVASKLWDAVVDIGLKNNYHCMEFKVHEDNKAAINLYIKKGCVLLNKEKNPDGRVRIYCRYIFNAKQKINHSLPSVSTGDIEAVSETMKSLNLATGKIVRQFETEISKFIGRKHAIAVSSGTSALHIALRTLGVSKGDEVIIPSFVCYGVLSAVLATGATAVPADINEINYDISDNKNNSMSDNKNNDFNISLADTKKRITSKTKAIIVAHMFGKSMKDVEEFNKLGIPVIEDAAQSLGSVHNIKYTGSFGIISVFSFNATKMITSGVGGMILTDSYDLHKKAENLLKYDQRDSVGESYNYRMSDIQASLGIHQFGRIKSIIARRNHIALKYTERITEMKIDLKLPDLKENVSYRFVALNSKAKNIIKNLQRRGIMAESPVFNPLHRYLNFEDSAYPNTTKAFNESISLPIYPELTDEAVDDITGALSNWNHIEDISVRNNN